MDYYSTLCIERSLRYHLRKTGHRLYKSLRSLTYGNYWIIDTETGSVVLGCSPDCGVTIWRAWGWAIKARRDAGQRMNRYGRAYFGVA